MIVVTGAAGNVGRELVAQLVAAGQPVRAIVRRTGDSQSLPPEAETVVADLNRPDTLTDALAGASAIHLLAGYEGLAELLANARAAGVRHVVLQSSSAAPTGDLSNAVADGTVDETTVQPAVQQLLGRPPGSFAQWAENHADLFAS
jgi:uncharacterized protein YbjT (DUF2867 family)